MSSGVQTISNLLLATTLNDGGDGDKKLASKAAIDQLRVQHCFSLHSLVNRMPNKHRLNTKLLSSFTQVILAIPCAHLLEANASLDAELAARPELDAAQEELLLENLLKQYYYRYRYLRNIPLFFKDFQHCIDIFVPNIIYNTYAQMFSGYMASELVERRVFHFKTLAKVEMYKPFSVITAQAMFDASQWHEAGELASERYFLDQYLVIIEANAGPAYGFIQSMAFYDFTHKVYKQLNPKAPFPPNLVTGELTRSNSSLLVQCEVKVLADDCDKFRDCRVPLKMRPIGLMSTYIKLIETLERMCKRESFFKHLILPNLDVCRPNQESFSLINIEKYNPGQQNVINCCLQSVIGADNDQHRFLFVQGPPGTGKTHTLVGLVENLFVNWNKSHRLRIMIAAPSNGAIDEVGRRLLEHSEAFKKRFGRGLDIVRLGRIDKLKDEIVPVHLNIRVGEHRSMMMQEMDEEAKITFKDVRAQMFRDMDIILTTLGSSQKPMQDELFLSRTPGGKPKVSIDLLIVDESGQTSEPELMMPLVYPINKCIFIGDHQQLPATVVSKAAMSHNFGRSLLERFILYFEKNHSDSVPILRLSDQYRMHSDIVRLPSRVFYDGRLNTPLRTTGRNPLVALKSYLVFDLKDTAEKMNMNRSFVNEGEIKFILKLLKAIVVSCDLNVDDDEFPISIGVITFYSGQKEELELAVGKLYNGKLLPKIHIDSVDGFQGRELDVSILSAVRTEAIGFLRLVQRMNVALTRARSSQFVCLKAEPFRQVPHWKDLLEDANDRGRLVSLEHDIADNILQLLIIPSSLD